MSNYTKTTNFATKDSLSSGDPAKKIKGTEFNTEFDNLATAIATKADLASPALTGTPTAPTATTGTNTTQVATTAFVQTEIAASGSGTVTSVDMTVPAFLSVSGNPVTSSGTLAVALSGTALPVANGGTGNTSYTNGQLLIGNTTGNTLTKATLTAGSGVSITNGNGSITISATGTSGVSTFSAGTTGLLPSTGTSGDVVLSGTLAVANGGTGSTTASGARSNLGLGSIATQNSSSVSITGGSISGITDLAVADGGTGSSTAAGARTNLGLGTMATATATDYVNVASTQTVSGTKTFTSNSAFGATSPSTAWNLYVKSQAAQPATAIECAGSTSQGVALFSNGSSVGQIFYWGSAATPGSSVGSIGISSTATTYNTSSDYRLKDNATPMTGSWSKVKALKPVNYTWKVNGEQGEGFIAHELQAVIPLAVTGVKDAIDEQGNAKYQGVDYSKVVPVLTAALQEALARIEALEAKVN